VNNPIQKILYQQPETSSNQLALRLSKKTGLNQEAIRARIDRWAKEMPKSWQNIEQILLALGYQIVIKPITKVQEPEETPWHELTTAEKWKSNPELAWNEHLKSKEQPRPIAGWKDLKRWEKWKKDPDRAYAEDIAMGRFLPSKE
jgi:hypothetical protein